MAFRSSYEPAIDRLQELLFRLNDAERPVVLPESAVAAPTPGNAKPAAARMSIVVAMKPKRRERHTTCGGEIGKTASDGLMASETVGAVVGCERD